MLWQPYFVFLPLQKANKLMVYSPLGEMPCLFLRVPDTLKDLDVLQALSYSLTLALVEQ